MHILPYCSRPAEFRAYDPEATEIARLIWSAIQSVEPQLQVEHVGSTSVPNCGGKGIVDLAILYPERLSCPRASRSRWIWISATGWPGAIPRGAAHARGMC